MNVGVYPNYSLRKCAVCNLQIRLVAATAESETNTDLLSEFVSIYIYKLTAFLRFLCFEFPASPLSIPSNGWLLTQNKVCLCPNSTLDHNVSLPIYHGNDVLWSGRVFSGVMLRFCFFFFCK